MRCNGGLLDKRINPGQRHYVLMLGVLAVGVIVTFVTGLRHRRNREQQQQRSQHLGLFLFHGFQLALKITKAGVFGKHDGHQPEVQKVIAKIGDIRSPKVVVNRQYGSFFVRMER